MKYGITGEDIPEARGPYSQGTTAGRLVFASGQVACDPRDSSKLVEGGVAEQTERILDIVEIILSKVDCTLSDVAQATVYLTSVANVPQMDEVFGRRFGSPGPARTVVAVSELPMGALVEMDCVACR